MDLFGGNTADAVISPCGAYRYLLGRAWDSGRPLCCWIGLNPSTADATQDDATVRRMCRFAADWGHGGIVLVNLFAYRSTDPRALFDVFYRRQFTRPDGTVAYHNGDPVGPENDHHILAAARKSTRVIAAWGNHGVMMLRDEAVLKLLRGEGVRVECLGKTAGGQPKHPVRLRADLKPVELDPPVFTGVLDLSPRGGVVPAE